jgi:tRNA (cytidine32/uridine32-2'-O)-methyltransferase
MGCMDILSPGSLKRAGHSIRKAAAKKWALGLHGIAFVASVEFAPFSSTGAPKVLQNIRIVLVNTSHPGNIGGAARAMKNMGLSRLVLVDPNVFPSAEASARASGADDILANAVVVPTLEEALVGCSLVMGTSARDRSLPWPLLDPRACAAKAMEGAQAGGEVALVFGREHAGLTNEELQRCHFHVHIPSAPEFSSLNLAAAVQVLAYEVRLAFLALATAEPTQAEPAVELATTEELEGFYGHMEATLVDIGFLDPEKPRHLMARLRRLYSRCRLERTEVSILRGILTETRKTARGEPYKRKDQ